MAMKRTEARAIARSAYMFLYPLVVNYGTMYVEALDPTSPFFGGGSVSGFTNASRSAPRLLSPRYTRRLLARRHGST